MDGTELGGRLGMGTQAAVVVVDAVCAYSEPGSPLYLESGRQALESIAEILGCARSLGVPVLYTTVRYENSASAEAPVFARKVPALRVFNKGSEWAEVDPAVAPAQGEPVLVKRYASGFFQTDLLGQLQRLGRDTVIIVGFSTSGCIRATAVDAIQHDLIPIVVRDAVADRTPAISGSNLADLEAKYADVMQSGDVTKELHRIKREEARK